MHSVMPIFSDKQEKSVLFSILRDLSDYDETILNCLTTKDVLWLPIDGFVSEQLLSHVTHFKSRV